MTKSLNIRRTILSDYSAISDLVSRILAEKYGHLLTEQQIICSVQGPWIGSWVVEKDSKIIAVGLAKNDCIDDLWVSADHRNEKVGSLLLKKLENKIIGSGHLQGKLRVINENKDAIRFYITNGWSKVNTYPHEVYDFLMVDLVKNFSPAR